MITIAFVTDTGQIASYATVAEGIYEDGVRYGDHIARIVPEFIPQEDIECYWYNEGNFVYIGARPSPFYAATPGGWVPDMPRIRDLLLARSRIAQREADSALQVEYDGRAYNASLSSQNELTAALMAGGAQEWRDAGNEIILLSESDIRSLLSLVRDARQNVLRESWALRDEVSLLDAITPRAREIAQSLGVSL